MLRYALLQRPFQKSQGSRRVYPKISPKSQLLMCPKMTLMLRRSETFSNFSKQESNSKKCIWIQSKDYDFPQGTRSRSARENGKVLSSILNIYCHFLTLFGMIYSGWLFICFKESINCTHRINKEVVCLYEFSTSGIECYKNTIASYIYVQFYHWYSLFLCLFFK